MVVQRPQDRHIFVLGQPLPLHRKGLGGSMAPPASCVPALQDRMGCGAHLCNRLPDGGLGLMQSCARLTGRYFKPLTGPHQCLQGAQGGDMRNAAQHQVQGRGREVGRLPGTEHAVVLYATEDPVHLASELRVRRLLAVIVGVPGSGHHGTGLPRDSPGSSRSHGASQLPTIHDFDPPLSPSARAPAISRSPEDLQPGDHLAKRRVLAIEVRTRGDGHEELRNLRVGLPKVHGAENARRRVRQAETLIRKLGPVNGGRSTATLHGNAAEEPVELGAFVMVPRALLSGAEGPEALGSPRHHIPPELHDHAAHVKALDRDIKEHQRLSCLPTAVRVQSGARMRDTGSGITTGLRRVRHRCTARGPTRAGAGACSIKTPTPTGRPTSGGCRNGRATSTGRRALTGRETGDRV